MTEFTIAICTYKRSALLRNTLQSLRGIEQIEKPWELLIVDNAGDSGTKAVAEEFSKLLPVRYVTEPKLGISYARNRAITEARAPIILFTDDDVTFHSSWFSNMYKAISVHSECDFWGGRVEAIWSKQKPSWFEPKYCPMLNNIIVEYNLGAESRYWNPQTDNPFPTVNIALRMATAKKVNMFDTKLGIIGKRRIGGEDASLIKKISQAGSKGWYAADAKIHHIITPGRITKKYTYSYAWLLGNLSVYFVRQEHNRLPRWLYSVAFTKFMSGLKEWLRGIVRRDSGECFAGQFVMLFNLSKLWHAVLSQKK